MVRIDCLIFGYRKYKVSPENIAELTNALLKVGVTAQIKGDGTVTVRERDRRKILSALSGLDYTESPPRGIAGALKKIPYKPAVVSALFISALISLFLSGLVWDVRVDGNHSIPDAAIISELERCGFSVGNIWSLVDLSEVEIKVLSECEDIGWININRRGTVAYVTVMERKYGTDDKAEIDYRYSNIVASTDCVIEDITVKRGRAVVKKGDTVKKGDVLVLGTLPIEAGGGFCRADAVITGRVNDTVSVAVSRNYEQKIELRRQCRTICLEIFGVNINIFKKYGNLSESCDIIEEINPLTLLGKCKLPVTVKKSYEKTYGTQSLSYTDTELVEVATARLRAKTAARLELADLMKIRTEGRFTEDGYEITNYISLCESVAEYAPFEVE